MPSNPAAELAEDIYKAMTHPSQPPMPQAKRDTLKSGLALASLAVDALMRIADAADKMAPTRPVHDPLDGM